MTFFLWMFVLGETVIQTNRYAKKKKRHLNNRSKQKCHSKIIIINYNPDPKLNRRPNHIEGSRGNIQASQWSNNTHHPQRTNVSRVLRLRQASEEAGKREAQPPLRTVPNSCTLLCSCFFASSDASLRPLPTPEPPVSPSASLLPCFLPAEEAAKKQEANVDSLLDPSQPLYPHLLPCCFASSEACPRPLPTVGPPVSPSASLLPCFLPWFTPPGSLCATSASVFPCFLPAEEAARRQETNVDSFQDLSQPL